MLSIRTTKTGSGATAVQIVRYEQRKKVIVAHMGSAHTDAKLHSLKSAAHSLIERRSKQLRLLPDPSASKSTLIALDKYRYVGMRYSFLYATLHRVCDVFSFHTLKQPLAPCDMCVKKEGGGATGSGRCQTTVSRRLRWGNILKLNPTVPFTRSLKPWNKSRMPES